MAIEKSYSTELADVSAWLIKQEALLEHRGYQRGSQEWMNVQGEFKQKMAEVRAKFEKVLPPNK